MEVQITARHFELSDRVKSYIEEKVQRIVRYAGSDIPKIEVILTAEKHRQTAEFSVHVHRHDFISKEESDDIYNSVDLAIESLEKQLQRTKERLGDRRNRGAKYAGTDAETVEETDEDDKPTPTKPKASKKKLDAAVSSGAPRIVQTHTFGVKPMSLDEAALQLRHSDEAFLAFMNASTRQVNVLYKRNDGTYGLVEPEA